VARHRRERRGPGPARHPRRPVADGQASPGLHDVPGHVKLTGRKDELKLYRRHSGYEGGLREERAKDVRARNPIRLVEEAVRGMLPKTTLGDAMYRKLKVYAGPDHPHAAQKPTKLEVA
jgi:ribosomal protein L13